MNEYDDEKNEIIKDIDTKDSEAQIRKRVIRDRTTDMKVEN